MTAIFKPNEKILGNNEILQFGEAYMVDGFIACCQYHNLTVGDYKSVTFAIEVRNCDKKERKKDYHAEPERDRVIVVLRDPKNKRLTAIEAAMMRALDKEDARRT